MPQVELIKNISKDEKLKDKMEGSIRGLRNFRSPGQRWPALEAIRLDGYKYYEDK